MASPARIALAASSFAGKRSGLLSYGEKLVEDVGIPPTSTGCKPVVSCSLTDPPWYPRQESHPDLGVRSAVL
jgi:hypothetical protein